MNIYILIAVLFGSIFLFSCKQIHDIPLIGRTPKDIKALFLYYIIVFFSIVGFISSFVLLLLLIPTS